MVDGSAELSTAQQASPPQKDAVLQLAQELRLVADETRLRILSLLAQGEQCVCHITEALGLSQPLASYHLGMLKEAGWVSDRRDSRWVYYSIEVQRMREISQRFVLLFDANRMQGRPATCAPQECLDIREQVQPQMSGGGV
jgi:DNA-binding transcriptional ArsR family regulator